MDEKWTLRQVEAFERLAKAQEEQANATKKVAELADKLTKIAMREYAKNKLDEFLKD